MSWNGQADAERAQHGSDATYPRTIAKLKCIQRRGHRGFAENAGIWVGMSNPNQLRALCVETMFTLQSSYHIPKRLLKAIPV